MHAIHEAYTHARPTVIQSDCSALVQGLRSAAADAEQVGVPEADVNAVLTEAAKFGTVEDLPTIGGRGKSRGVLTSLRLLWGKRKLQSLSDRIIILQTTHQMLNEAREWKVFTSRKNLSTPQPWSKFLSGLAIPIRFRRSASTAEVSLETVGTTRDSSKDSKDTSKPCKVFEVDMVCESTKTVVTAVTEGSSSG
ncbi:hypothetical protein DACRYDRAFT_111437 [Dacryopinax primogenitus]|uniref:Uncharacterized protein n=1 Tax=Dacryopinax primogenitus (strain DJM 731) TaxID=1858805 RepID=M5G2C3_DACPD|nr:uncharacterized protein DACRYDRAFT_111437 [Dacryopinax primogenitus]EJT97917.1 hypothetical protein DACRYDRAFT_111437 [Dacryopinax primogenitus]